MLLLLLSGTDIKTLELAKQAAVEYRLQADWTQVDQRQYEVGHDEGTAGGKAARLATALSHPATPSPNLWWSVSLLALPAVPTKGTAVTYAVWPFPG